MVWAMSGLAGADTFTVTNLNDSGPGSLRKSIADAAAGDTIDFGVTGTIILTSGELTITQDLSIEGPGSGDLAISGNDSSSIFVIGRGTVTIADVTILDGRPGGFGVGGGISNYGTLTLANSTVSGNESQLGGGIYNNEGTVTLDNSTISGNAATDGGGIFNDNGTLALTNSTVGGNRVEGGDGGIFNVGTLTISSSTISDNTADTQGGGIYNATQGATLTLTNSTVSGNIARFGGEAGGIFNEGTLTLTITTISGNEANDGGGIFNVGTVTLTNSPVSANTATKSDGILNGGAMTLSSSTIRENTADSQGGGIYNATQGATLTLTNSTVSGNSAAHGGGIFSEGTATLGNSTVSGNTATDGGGGISNTAFGAAISLVNTILAGNTADSGIDCTGDLTSLGHNLVGSTAGCGFSPATGDLVNVNPMLAPLADNGGPNFTQAVLPGGPAFDAGDDEACTDTDQRGVTRPQGVACDIGAYEAIVGVELLVPEDVNRDGEVNTTDLTFILENWSVTGHPRADLSRDGLVDIWDLAMVARYIGK